MTSGMHPPESIIIIVCVIRHNCCTFLVVSYSLVCFAEAPVLITQSNTVSVTEGRDIQLTCTMKVCYPATGITWFNSLKQSIKNTTRKYVVQSSAAWSSLTVQDTDSMQDSGQYWCSATNAVGAAEIPILLVVKGKLVLYYTIFSSQSYPEKRKKRKEETEPANGVSAGLGMI
uniref:Ig-like domain-containing protein n=1 Tax=Denticeps clupeoides TaxID=299321 RepID=A0AAY4CN82_9TELE